MFSMSMLPDLTPRDPHSLWYTSRHAPSSVPHHLLTTHDPSSGHHDPASHAHGHGHGHGHHPHPRDRDHRRALVERTPLARLRHDEQLMERRRANVSNYGSAWLKPLGVPKTLFQMREERREAEEQAEVQRREQQLAAQLAEAEAEAETEGGMMMDGDEPMEDEEGEEEEQDLDEDIPEAEGFGFDGEDSEDEDEETVTGSEGSDAEDHAGAVLVSPAEQEQVRDMRAAEDRLREMMARGQDGGSEVGDAFADEESREGLLEEDDLVHIQDTPAVNADESMGMDMDMDADLDEDIPEGDDGYEHTDSEEEISDDATRELSFAGRSVASGRTPYGSRLRRSMQGGGPRSSLRSRVSLPQSDMDISSLLSNNESSYLEDSPQMMRRGV